MKLHFLPASALALACLLAASKVFAEDISNTATNPAPRDANWVIRHEGFVNRAKEGNVELLFLGDSITDFFPERGSNVWNKFYAPRHAVNFGISGDRTEHVLWRLDNGELDGIKPKVIVLMIGTNNTGQNTTPEIVEGITLILKRIHDKSPDTKVLLLSIFPRGKRTDPLRDRVQNINTAIAKLNGGNVTYLDIHDKFLDANGTLPRDVMPDLLHPDEKGYQIWADATEETLVKLLK